MKFIEDTLQSPIVGIKTDDFEMMEKVSSCPQPALEFVMTDSILP